MSYTYLPEPGAESSAECYSDTPQFALWKLNPTAERSYSKGSETESCRDSRYGTTCEPSTGNLGADVLTSFAADSPAKIFPPPERGPESAAKGADCGPKCPESLARFDPVSRSWKTRQCLLLGGLESFSETWPRWGMMRDGECLARLTPEHLTSEIESGLSPNGVDSFHAPNTTGLDGGSNSRKALRKRQEMWPTPRAGKTTDENEETWMVRHMAGKVATPPLSLAVKMWPTPAARDCKGANSREHCETNGTGRKHMDQLANAVAHPDLRFATPQARDFRTGSKDRWENPERSRNLNDQIGGQLNPTWVEWLMGWPLGWTDCAASATDKFRQWLRSHSEP